MDDPKQKPVKEGIREEVPETNSEPNPFCVKLFSDTGIEDGVLRQSLHGMVDTNMLKPHLQALGLRAETADALYLLQVDEFYRPTEVPWVRRLVSELKKEELQASFHSCFLSHSSADQDFAEHLCTDLGAAGVRVWFAPRDMNIGDKIRSRIEMSIEANDRFLIVLSANSIKSGWVESEVEACFERERRLSLVLLYPIRIDDAVMTCNSAWASEIRRTRHIGDFVSWRTYPEKCAKVLEGLLNVLLKRPL